MLRERQHNHQRKHKLESLNELQSIIYKLLLRIHAGFGLLFNVKL